jgi:hypothetical protein
MTVCSFCKQAHDHEIDGLFCFWRIFGAYSQLQSPITASARAGIKVGPRKTHNLRNASGGRTLPIGDAAKQQTGNKGELEWPLIRAKPREVLAKRLRKLSETLRIPAMTQPVEPPSKLRKRWLMSGGRQPPRPLMRHEKTLSARVTSGDQKVRLVVALSSGPWNSFRVCLSLLAVTRDTRWNVVSIICKL